MKFRKLLKLHELQSSSACRSPKFVMQLTFVYILHVFTLFTHFGPRGIDENIPEIPNETVILIFRFLIGQVQVT